MQENFTVEELNNLKILLLNAQDQNVLIALEIIQNTLLDPSLERIIALLFFTNKAGHLSMKTQEQIHSLFRAFPAPLQQCYETELALLSYHKGFSKTITEVQIKAEIHLFQQQYGSYLNQRPHLHYPFIWVGNFLKDDGLESLAEQIYLLCITWGSKDEQVFFNQAILEEYKNKNHKAAIPYYQQLLQLNPTHYTAHSNIGLMYQEVEQTDDAIHHFQQAIQLRPKHTRALNNLAYIYWKDKNKYEEASALYEQVLQLNPRYNYALANYAALLIEQDKTQLKRAEKMLRKAIDIDPTFDYPWKILGHLMLAKTPPKKKAAINAYKKAHLYDPEDEETLAALRSLNYKK